MKFIATVLFLGVIGSLSASDANESLAFVDGYLTRWDQFAQGRNELGPYIRDNRGKFENELSALLRTGEKKAVSRVVFYTVVQIGGSIDVDSELGRETLRIVGPLPLTDGENGEKILFAGDLYFWWEEQKNNFPAFPLYLEWEKRDFTQNVAIRLYKSVRENQKNKG